MKDTLSEFLSLVSYLVTVPKLVKVRTIGTDGGMRRVIEGRLSDQVSQIETTRQVVAGKSNQAADIESGLLESLRNLV